MRRVLLILVCLGLTSTASAEAPLSAQQILDKMDATNNAFADQTMDIRLTVIDVDGSKKSYDMTVLQKGDSKRLVTFTSGEMKGMATLVEEQNSVYVYLPGYKKVRRVAAHNMNQSLAGSDMSSEDMATTAWSKDWTPTLDSEDATSWTLVLAPKPGVNVSYGKVTHKVDKKTFGQLETRYYDKSGTLVKLLQSSEPTDFHGTQRARFVTVSDPRTNHKTVLETRDLKVNQGLKDDLFTVRQLQWGK
jgi:outer membrane lipoprotein-sorting protein